MITPGWEYFPDEAERNGGQAHREAHKCDDNQGEGQPSEARGDRGQESEVGGEAGHGEADQEARGRQQEPPSRPLYQHQGH